MLLHRQRRKGEVREVRHLVTNSVSVVPVALVGRTYLSATVMMGVASAYRGETFAPEGQNLRDSLTQKLGMPKGGRLTIPFD